jgi:hypothetical protein
LGQGAADATPVPVRLAVCGDPEALSATDSVAAKLAAVAGVNVTYMKQLEPAANVAPQAFAPVVNAKSLGLAPVRLATMLFNGAVPVFDSVAANAAEVVPVTVFGKASDGVSEATGAVPVPVKLAVCGDPEALSATDSVAEKAVAEAGVNVT